MQSIHQILVATVTARALVARRVLITTVSAAALITGSAQAMPAYDAGLARERAGDIRVTEHAYSIATSSQHIVAVPMRIGQRAV